MGQTVQDLYGRLLRSKLLPPEEARAARARWEAEAGGGGDPARFAAWLAGQKLLTEYQAALLARGHSGGFFLGEYRVLDKLGKGRMAGVYKARHRLGAVVALKVLPASKAREPNLLARFRREASLSLQFNHPNVVRAFQVGNSGGVHYLVLEYLEGETLEDVLQRRGKLPPAEAVRLVHQALQGLQHLYEQGLVHRDLKPANLMVVGGGPSADLARCTVKILDIGLGRVTGENVLLAAEDGGLTELGVVLGTPDYMAPEQARDPRAADVRSDVYSLGCVLYHALAGRPPFPDTSMLSQMMRHANEEPRPLREFNLSVPDGLQQIVGWMLAKDPAQRYPTPERAAQALAVYLAAGDAPAPAPSPDPNLQSFLAWLKGADGTTAHVVAGDGDRPRAPTAPDPGDATEVGVDADAAVDAGDAADGGDRLRGYAEPVPEVRGLSRRDLVAFGLGAAAGAAAAVVGCLLALAGRRDRPTPP